MIARGTSDDDEEELEEAGDPQQSSLLAAILQQEHDEPNNPAAQDDPHDGDEPPPPPPPPERRPPSRPSAPPQQRLPPPLRVLFALNGLTLALPTTALLYMVNTRVHLPVPWMPTYAAVSFLPYSLKPAFAYYASSSSIRRDRSIAALLLAQGAVTAATAYIPPQHAAAVLLLAFAFATSLLAAWPEFLLGLTLLEHAHAVVVVSDVVSGENDDDDEDGNRDTAAAAAVSTLQAQAATARSAGSLVAHLAVVTLLAGMRWWNQQADALNDTTVALLLGATGLLNGMGAAVAWMYEVGVVHEVIDAVPPTTTTNVDDHHETLNPLCKQPKHDKDDHDDEKREPGMNVETFLEVEEESSSLRDPLLPPPVNNESLDEAVSASSPPPNLSSDDSTTITCTNLGLMVLLQISVIVLTLRHPIAHATSPLAFNLLAGAFVTALLLLLGIAAAAKATTADSTTTTASTSPWRRQYRVGLYLILRNAVPNFAYLMSSYFYTVFVAAPSLLQLFALWDTCVTTFACWTYERFWSRTCYNSTRGGKQLLWLIAGTTMLASMASLGNVGLIRLLDHSDGGEHHHTVKRMAWTLVVKAIVGFTSEWKFLPDLVLATASVHAPSTAAAAATGHPPHQRQPADTTPTATASSTSLQYGSLVACIDFGGQLGALLAGPLVALVGTSLGNDWAHLDWLQEINSAATLGSILLLVLLL